jgi:hypothetical protein
MLLDLITPSGRKLQVSETLKYQNFIAFSLFLRNLTFMATNMPNRLG